MQHLIEYWLPSQKAQHCKDIGMGGLAPSKAVAAMHTAVPHVLRLTDLALPRDLVLHGLPGGLAEHHLAAMDDIAQVLHKLLPSARVVIKVCVARPIWDRDRRLAAGGSKQAASSRGLLAVSRALADWQPV